MTFTPTTEQSAIVDRVRSTSDSLIISALAGAAKTSTLELIANAVSTPTLSLAFNKRIAEELKKRLPSHVTPMTLNGIGHRVWSAGLASRPKLEAGKMFGLLSAEVEALPRGAAKEAAYEDFSELLRTLRTAKSAGYLPRSLEKRGLIDDDEFYGGLEYRLEDSSIDLIEATLTKSIYQARKGILDFDDQILMPTLFGGAFPQFPLVTVDEAQDLSPLNHAMLKKIARKRLIVVGDQNQSIYGFRGAVTSGMSVLAETFGLAEMTLTTSFRCPRAVVALARLRAPQMQYPDWAIEGEVTYPNRWSAAEIPDGAAIICRLNAPLMKCALHLIRLGRGVNLVGSDLGPSLQKALDRLGPPTLSREEALTAIDQWEKDRLRKVRSPGATKDRAECLRVFVDFGTTLGGAQAYCRQLFSARGPVLLMSGHKSKGGEWDTVYHLEPSLIPSEYATRAEALEQEYNLQYVITTRAKKALHHVTLDSLVA